MVKEGREQELAADEEMEWPQPKRVSQKLRLDLLGVFATCSVTVYFAVAG